MILDTLNFIDYSVNKIFRNLCFKYLIIIGLKNYQDMLLYS